MKKIYILIPYFGKLPKNMITFLMSCKKNPTINWLIFTNDPEYTKLQSFCSNVTFIKSNLNWIKKRILKITNLRNIVLDKPYKMCDYRPLYGMIFSKYIKNCDYWGYSDLDIVYGDLWPYIRYGVEHGYNKIGSHGHFTLIRNSLFANNMYNLPVYLNGKKIYLFKNIVSKSHRSCDFDEMGGIDVICQQHNIKVYNNKYLVNDINAINLDINTVDNDKFWVRYSCYFWNNGRAEFFYIIHGKLKEHDYGYFHFQKRKAFKYYINDSSINLFSITTYGYHKVNHLNITTIKCALNQNRSSLFQRVKYRLYVNLFTDVFATRMHIGKVHFPIKHILNNIIHCKIRSLKM